MTETTVSSIRVKQLGLLPIVNPDYSFDDLPKKEEVWEAAQPDITRARRSDSAVTIDDDELKKMIEMSLEEVHTIEKAARNPKRWEISPEEARRIQLIVDFSAPGTYLLPAKDDRYKGKPWAQLMDRTRADATAIWGIHLAGRATGKDYAMFTQAPILTGLDSKQNVLQDGVRKSIREAGIHFVYIGTPQEGAAIEKVAGSSSSFIPPDKLTVIDGDGIKNTVDQVQALGAFMRKNLRTPHNPQGFLSPDASVAFTLGAQAVRVFRMCNAFDTIPKSMPITLLPLPTPQGGLREYPQNEMCGAMYYALTGAASLDPVPYKIFGDE